MIDDGFVVVVFCGRIEIIERESESNCRQEPNYDCRGRFEGDQCYLSLMVLDRSLLDG